MSDKRTFFLLLACLFKVVLSFKDNVDTTNPTIFNRQNSGLFGHSVALSKSDAFVGAPEDEIHGNVFKCSLQSENCKKMNNDEMSHKNHRNFFGSTVTIHDDNVATCAFREILALKTLNVFYESESGVCYTAKIGEDFKEDFQWRWFNSESKVKTVEEYTYKNKWQVASLMGPQHIQTESGIIFNAPFARHKDFKKGDRVTGTIVKKPNGDSKFIMAEGNWNSDYENSATNVHTLDETGSAIVQGKFYENPDEDFADFAIGAPNADRYQGRVYLCEKCFKEGRFGRKTYQADEPQMGERFGSALAAVKISKGAELDDLVVGAPLYSTTRYGSIGRVVIFQNGDSNQKKVLESPNNRDPRGRFGFVIANLGDIDGDGFGDFAVGAPGINSVFVYFGHPNFEFGAPQEIKGSGSGFGYSLSKNLIDVDDNGANDFAVGAPFDNSVSLYKTRKVVSFTPSVTIRPSEIDGAVKGFNVTFTIELDGEQSDQKIYATISLEKSSKFEPESITKFGVEKETKKNVTLRARNNNFVPKDSSIKSFWINGIVTFDLGCFQSSVACPRINIKSSSDSMTKLQEPNQITHSFRKRIDLRHECKSDPNNPDNCDCDLKSTKTALQKNLSIVVGDTRNEWLDFDLDLTNDGSEPAYDVVVKFSFSGEKNMDLPMPIPTINGRNCTRAETGSGEGGGGQVKCSLPYINNEGGKINPKFKLPLKIPGLMGDLMNALKNLLQQDDALPQKLVIKASLESKCTNNKDMKLDDLEVNIAFDSQLKIEEQSESALGYGEEDLPFTQTFVVINQGPSFTKEPSKVQFFIPVIKDFVAMSSFNTNLPDPDCINASFEEDFQLKEKHNHHQLFCQRGNCLVKECTIPPGWDKGDRTDFNITLIFNATKANTMSETSEFSVITGAKIPDLLQVEASIELYSRELGPTSREAKVWPMVLGACLGLLLIVIMGIILWKTGLLAKMRPYNRKPAENQTNPREMRSLSTYDLPDN